VNRDIHHFDQDNTRSVMLCLEEFKEDYKLQLSKLQP
jgi:hypothetical protein